MTQGFCPAQKKKNYGGDVETMERAGLEGGDQAFMLDIVNLRCLLDIQVEMNPHLLQSYEVVSIVVPFLQTRYQSRKVNFSLFTQKVIGIGFKPRQSDTTALDFKH